MVYTCNPILHMIVTYFKKTWHISSLLISSVVIITRPKVPKLWMEIAMETLRVDMDHVQCHTQHHQNTLGGEWTWDKMSL